MIKISLISISIVLFFVTSSILNVHAQTCSSGTVTGGSGGSTQTGNITGGSVICINNYPARSATTCISPLDVVTLPYGAPASLDVISTHIIKIPIGDTSPVRVAVTNTGDAIYNLTVNVPPVKPSNSTIGIVGHSTFYLGEIPANGIKEFDVNVYPTVTGKVELPVQLAYSKDPAAEFGSLAGTNTPSSTGGSAVCNGSIPLLITKQ